MCVNKPAVLGFLFALTTLSCGKQEADLVLTNGDVYTVEEGQPWARAIVISGNEITAVLEDESEAKAYIGPGTWVHRCPRSFFRIRGPAARHHADER